MQSVSCKHGLARIQKILVGLHPVAILGATAPTQLLADVCYRGRSPADGPVTAWGEAAYVFLSPFGIVIIGVFALAVLTFKNQWLLAAGAGSAALGGLIYVGDSYPEIVQFGDNPICTGPTSIAVAICAIICLICAGIFVIKQRLRGDQNA